MFQIFRNCFASSPPTCCGDGASSAPAGAVGIDAELFVLAVRVCGPAGGRLGAPHDPPEFPGALQKGAAGRLHPKGSGRQRVLHQDLGKSGEVPTGGALHR